MRLARAPNGRAERLGIEVGRKLSRPGNFRCHLANITGNFTDRYITCRTVRRSSTFSRTGLTSLQAPDYGSGPSGFDRTTTSAAGIFPKGFIPLGRLVARAVRRTVG